jgi:hypothetical protein
LKDGEMGVDKQGKIGDPGAGIEFDTIRQFLNAIKKAFSAFHSSLLINPSIGIN